MYITASTADNHPMTKKSLANTTIHSKFVGFNESFWRALYVDKTTG